MDAQLHLITTEDPAAEAAWRLDGETVEAGRRGVALARQALRAARRPTVTDAAQPSAA